MYRIVYGLIVFLSSMILQCCRGRSAETVEAIVISDFKTESLLDLRMLSADARIIELKSEDVKIPANPIKCVLSDNYIYVLDRQFPVNDELLVFDMNGNYIQKVGGRGRGPGEYLGISDFAIAPDGSIWIEDAVANRMIKYRKDFSYQKSFAMEVDVECMEFISDNEILVGLAPWNGTDVQVAVMDTLFNIRRVGLKYSEYVDPAFLFSSPKFIKSDKGYFYSRPIDDSIYLFDTEGNIAEQYCLDFGKLSVRNEDKLDVGVKFDNGFFQDYTFLKSFGVVGDNYIIGWLFDQGADKQFVIDRKNEVMYKSGQGTVIEMLGYQDGALISKIYPVDADDRYKIEIRKISL